MEIVNFTETVNLKGYKLIIPSVSVGNVPQLMIDMVISTYHLKKVANIWHPAIVPSVGSDPFLKDSSELCTACELFANESLKLAAVQLRSSVDPKFAQEFFNLLITSIKLLNFEAVLLLSSAHAFEMHDVNSSKFRFLSNAPEMVEVISGVAPKVQDEHMQGVGFALKLYNLLVEQEVKCALLIKYTSEGDNRPDAVQLLEVLKKLISNLGSNLKDLKFPASWDYVFGNPAPLGIY